jgi:nitroreductase
MDKHLTDFYNIMYRRCSVRSYKATPVPPDVLDRLIETLRRAPSAANRQPWRFYVIKNDLRPKFNEVLYKPCFHNVPVLIAAEAVPETAWVRNEDKHNYAWVDVSIAMTDMVNAATAEGLGTCWIASFDVNLAKKLLELPDSAQLVTLMAVGYPEKELVAHDKVRKSLQEIITIL